MALEVCAFRAVCKRFKAHLLMVLVQMGSAFLYFITEASFNRGMNPHVYVAYRILIGGLVVFPFAYFLERRERTKITLASFLQIFMLSIMGTSLPLNLYFASLRYTSPTFIASMYNIVAPLTFVFAVILRLEALDIKNPRGIAKILGTILSLAGVMTMTFYKGPVVRSMWGALIHTTRNTVHENWIKGSILTIASCIAWSISFIMQAITLKKYPAQLSLAAWMNLIGGAISAIFTVFIQHKPKVWPITFNIVFWSTIYAGVMCSGLIIFIQLWCTKHKGPVFVTMFNPLSTILVAIIAYFILGERLYMGSILGGIIIIIGLYLLLWGKESDNEVHVKSQEQA